MSLPGWFSLAGLVWKSGPTGRYAPKVYPNRLSDSAAAADYRNSINPTGSGADAVTLLPCGIDQVSENILTAGAIRH